MKRSDRMADDGNYDEYDGEDYGEYDYENNVGEDDIDYSDLGVTLTDTGMPTDVEDSQQQSNKLKEFSSHSEHELKQITEGSVNEVKELMGVSASDARLLLHNYKYVQLPKIN